MAIKCLDQPQTTWILAIRNVKTDFAGRIFQEVQTIKQETTFSNSGLQVLRAVAQLKHQFLIKVIFIIGKVKYDNGIFYHHTLPQK